MGETVRVLLEIAGDATEALQSLRSIQAATNKVGSTIKAAIAPASSAASAALVKMTTSAQTASSTIQKVFGIIQQSSSSLGRGLAAAASPFAALGSAALSAASGIRESFDQAIGSVKERFSSISSGASDAAERLLSPFRGIGSRLGDAINADIGSIKERIASISEAGNGLASRLGSAASSAASALSRPFSGIAGAIAPIASAFSNVYSGIVSGVGGVSSALGSIGSAASSLGGRISSLFGSFGRGASGANALEQELRQVDSAADGAASGLQHAGQAAAQMGSQAEGARGRLRGIVDTMLGVAGGNLIAGGLSRIASGFTGIITGGLAFNSTLEQTTAKLKAFTGSNEAAAEVLEMVRERAAKTPFAFGEMADAAAALLPIAKQSGIGLEEMIAQAEVLAALNPGEGLAGAAFSLREAMGGDFLSIVERFNLPKKRLNELKAEGVPALEAITTAMREMGVDTSLVAGLGETAAGRLSTLQDTLEGLKATATAGLFEGLKTGMIGIQGLLDSNSESLQAFATAVGSKLGAAFSAILSGATRVGSALAQAFSAIRPALSPLAGLLGGIASIIGNNLQPIAAGFAVIAGGLLYLAIVSVTTALYGMAAAGLAAMAPFAPLIAAGAAVALVFMAFKNNLFGIRTAVQPVIAMFTTFGSYIRAVAEDGDYLNDFLADLPGPIQGIAISIGKVVNFFRELGNTFTTLGQYLRAVAQDGDYLNDFLGDLPGPIQAIAEPLGRMISFFRDVIEVFLMARDEGASLGEAFWAVGAAFGTLSGVTGPLGSVLGNLAMVLGSLLQAITSVGAALFSGDFAGAFGMMREFLPLIIADIQVFIGSLGTAFQAALPVIVAAVQSWGSAFLGWAARTFPPLLAALGNLITTIGAWISTQAPVLMGLLQSWGSAFIGWITPILGTILTTLGGFATALFGWIMAQAPLIMAQLLAWGSAFIGWITPILGVVLGALGGFASTIFAWIVEQAPVIMATLLSWGSAFIGWVAPILGTVLGALGGFASTIFAWIVEQAPAIIATLLSWGEAFIGWVTPILGTVLGALGGFASSIFAWIMEQAPGIIASLLAWGEAFIGWIAPAIPGLISALMGLMMTVPNLIIQYGPTILAALLQWGQNFIAWITPMIGPMLAQLASFGSSLLGWLGGMIGPILAQLGAWTAQFVSWVISMAPQFNAQFQAFLNQILTWLGANVGPILAKLGEWGVAMIAWVISMAPQFISTLLTWAAAFLGWVAPMLGKLLLALAGLAIAIIAFIGSTAATIIPHLLRWALAFAGWVATEAIPRLLSALGGLLSQMLGWIGGAASSVASSALAIGRSLIQGIVNGLGNVAASIREKLTAGITAGINAVKGAFGIKSPSKVLAKEIGEPLAEGVAAGIDKKKDEPAKALKNTVVDALKETAEMISSALKALQALAAYDGDALYEDAIGGFVNDVENVMTAVSNISGKFKAKTLEQAAAFSENAGKVLGWIGAAAKSLTELASYDGDSLYEDALYGFADNIETVVGIIADISGKFSPKIMEAAALFAENAGKVVGILGSAVDNLTKVQSYTTVGTFSMFVQALLGDLSNVLIQMRELAEDQIIAVVEYSAQFAEQAGKVISILGGAVDNLLKAQTYTSISGFSFAVQALLGDMSIVLIQMQELAQGHILKVVQYTALFAEQAGKVVSFLGSAVDSLLKVQGYESAEGFAIYISALLEDLSEAVDQLIIISENFDLDALQAAARFAESASKVVSLIGATADAFNKLISFSGVPAWAFEQLAQGIALAVDWMIQLADTFEADAVAAAAAFAESVGKVIAPIKASVEAFAALKDFENIPDTQMESLAADIYAAVYWMEKIASAMDSRGVAAAAAFAQKVGQVFGAIKQAVEAMTSLSNYKGVAPAAMQAFQNDFYGVLATISALLSQAQKGALDAGAFATALTSIASAIKAGTDAFSAIKGVGLNIGEFLASAFVVSQEMFQEGGLQTAELWLESIYLGLMESLPGFAEQLMGFWNELTQEAINPFLGAQEVGFELAARFWTLAASNALTNGVQQIKDAVNVGVVEPMNAALAAALEPVGKAAESVGAAITAGISAGISAGIPGLESQAKAAAEAAVAAAKAALVIASPSKVTEEEIGKPFVQGIGVGIKGGISELSGMISQGASSLVESFVGSFTGADWSMFGKLTDQVTSFFEDLVEQGRATAAQARKIVFGDDGSGGAQGVGDLMDDMISYIKQNGIVPEDLLSEIGSLLGDAGKEVFLKLQDQFHSFALVQQIQAAKAALDDFDDAAKRRADDAAAAIDAAQDQLARAKEDLDRAKEQIGGARSAAELRAIQEQVAAATERVRQQEDLVRQRENDADAIKRNDDIARKAQERDIDLLEARKEAVDDHLSGLEAASKYYEDQVAFLEKILELEGKRQEEIDEIEDLRRKARQGEKLSDSDKAKIAKAEQAQARRALIEHQAGAISLPDVESLNQTLAGVQKELTKSRLEFIQAERTGMVGSNMGLPQIGQQSIAFSPVLNISADGLSPEQARQIAQEAIANQQNIFLQQLNAMFGGG